jgi:DNA replication protein DnaC
MNSATMDKMRELRLHGMLRAFRDTHESSAYERLTSDEFLAHLIDAEWDERNNRTLKRLVKNASFRYRGMVEEIEFSQGRNIDKNSFHRLADGDWIGKAENLIITGATGSGKSFIACALGHAFCIRGMKVRYLNCMKLFSHLKKAKADGSYFREMKALAKQDLLILDDFGLKQLDAESRLFMLEFIEDRYGLKSTLISSQVPVNKWFDIIGDPTIADAICDRLVHNAHTINLKGGSMRKNRGKNSGQDLPPRD